MRLVALTAILTLSVVSPAVADNDPFAAISSTTRATTIKGFKATVKTTTDGTRHRNKVRIVGGAPRTVEVQFSTDGSTWVTTKTKKTDSAGRVRVVMKVAPERNRWRVNVPATANNSAITSAVKTFAVQVPETEAATVPFPTVSSTQILQSKAYARSYILSTYGWGDDQWFALEQLWTRESGWNHSAVNPSSGATGIPQSLPGDKMATAGADWKTNPQTQIRWGASYIRGRYGDPLGAWAHFQSKNWY